MTTFFPCQQLILIAYARKTYLKQNAIRQPYLQPRRIISAVLPGDGAGRLDVFLFSRDRIGVDELGIHPHHAIKVRPRKTYFCGNPDEIGQTKTQEQIKRADEKIKSSRGIDIFAISPVWNLKCLRCRQKAVRKIDSNVYDLINICWSILLTSKVMVIFDSRFVE